MSDFDGRIEFVPDHDAMITLGWEFAGTLVSGDVVMLHGDLGAGKTTFTQGLASRFGIAEAVQSPTFTIATEYNIRTCAKAGGLLHHLDLYRLEDPLELEAIGWERYIAPEDAVSVIEWPERAGDWLPERCWLVRIELESPVARRVLFSLITP